SLLSLSLGIGKTLFPGRVALPPAVGPEPGRGFVGIVGPAAEGDVPSRCLASNRVRVFVMKLEPTSLGAPPPVRGHECAATSVTVPDRPADLRRHVPRPRTRLPAFPVGRLAAQLPPLQLPSQNGQGASQDLPRI